MGGGAVAPGTDDGFTLIEAAMATLVLIVAVLSLTTVLVNSLTDTTFGRQRNAATNLANQTVEELRALPWTAIEQGMSSTDVSQSSDPNVISGTNSGQAENSDD